MDRGGWLCFSRNLHTFSEKILLVPFVAQRQLVLFRHVLCLTSQASNFLLSEVRLLQLTGARAAEALIGRALALPLYRQLQIRSSLCRTLFPNIWRGSSERRT